MKPPGFWTGQSGPGGKLAETLLSPISWIYAAVSASKIRNANPVEVPAAVICIGNISMGGTGKTPVTQTALNLLGEAGISAGSLSRGYGGSMQGPEKVDPEAHSASDVGDEPLLLARSGPAWISRDRVAGAQAMAAEGMDLVLMDDGHQNPSLHKDLSLIVIDADAGWGNGNVFPAGPLREPVHKGLARADAVILMQSGPDAQVDYEALGLAHLERPVLKAWLEAEPHNFTGKYLAFAGIGRPQKFYDSLKQAGADIVETQDFADHHPYSIADLERLDDLASSLGARLITTEKDAIRLPADFAGKVETLPVRAVFAEPARFMALAEQAMDAAAARR